MNMIYLEEISWDRPFSNSFNTVHSPQNKEKNIVFIQIHFFLLNSLSKIHVLYMILKVIQFVKPRFGQFDVCSFPVKKYVPN